MHESRDYGGCADVREHSRCFTECNLNKMQVSEIFFNFNNGFCFVRVDNVKRFTKTFGYSFCARD